MSDKRTIYQTCPTCRFIHAVGEPCPKCYHADRDAKDIQKHREVFGILSSTERVYVHGKIKTEILQG